MSTIQAIQMLHSKCAVYTSPLAAERLLDLAGWASNTDLRSATLLEPCVGEGAILLEGVRRLIQSFRSRGIPLRTAALKSRIKGFEFHAATAARTRRATYELLVSEGLTESAARTLSDYWISRSDFLLSEPGKATHIAANPPYLRWSKIPPRLSIEYRHALEPSVTNGDLSVAFLDRMLSWATPEGCVSALVNDRWMFTQYGEKFLHDRVVNGEWRLEVVDDRPTNAFVKKIGAYSAIVRIRRRSNTAPKSRSPRRSWRKVHLDLLAAYGPLSEAGCAVRVGPALGAGYTFLVNRGSDLGIEKQLLRPFVDRDQLGQACVVQSNTLAAVPFDNRGRQISLADWPGYAEWIGQYKLTLTERSCVRQGRPWWRTIDAVGPQWDRRPKLLIPELCKTPFASLDTRGSLPAHSIYAVWPTEWPIAALQRVLNAGLLELTAQALAPKVGQGWFRFYKRFLVQTPLPKWSVLSSAARAALQSKNAAEFDSAFSATFGFLPGCIGTARGCES